jgi:hypothetical protein
VTQDEKPKFLEMLNTLFGAHGRTVWDGALAGYWKGLEKMSLMQFERVVGKAIDKLQYSERGVAKVPTVPELWDLHRGIRHEQPKPQQEPTWTGDAWDTAANLLLLAYFERKKGERMMERYAPDSPYSDRAHHVVVSERTKARTAVLVKWKDFWARDMREDRAEGGKRDGKPYWFDCMSRAEVELDRLIAAEEVAA